MTEMTCYLCGRAVEDIDYCWGCKEYICQDCNETDASGNHYPEDHVRNYWVEVAEEEDEEDVDNEG